MLAWSPPHKSIFGVEIRFVRRREKGTCAVCVKMSEFGWKCAVVRSRRRGDDLCYRSHAAQIDNMGEKSICADEGSRAGIGRVVTGGEKYCWGSAGIHISTIV